MDRKTLEYMEGRAKKAREIVTQIEKLLKDSERVANAREITIGDAPGNTLAYISNRHSDKETRLIHNIKPALQQMIADEIALLEKELAEL